MRVLFLTHRLPYAPNRGDRVRAFHMLRQLKTFADVDLVSLVHDPEEAAHLDEARSLATTVSGVKVGRLRNLLRSTLAYPTSRPLSHTMLDSPHLMPVIHEVVRANRPDVVFAFCTGIAHAVIGPPLDAIPLVLDMVDVDSAKWRALAATTGVPRRWVYEREARCLARFEIGIARRAFVTFLTTDKERDTLSALAPGARIEVVENGVDAEILRSPGLPESSPTVVFCGVMNYAPNEEGAIWLARKVWPLVRKEFPNALLKLVGSAPTRTVQQLASQAKGVMVTGHVEDVRAHLWRSAVAAAPLHTARGVQNKVLEAVAAGLPTVITSVVLRGVPLQIRGACSVADEPEAFASAIVGLLAVSPAERRAIAARADVAAIGWTQRLRDVPQLVRNAAKQLHDNTGR